MPLCCSSSSCYCCCCCKYFGDTSGKELAQRQVFIIKIALSPLRSLCIVDTLMKIKPVPIAAKNVNGHTYTHIHQELMCSIGCKETNKKKQNNRGGAAEQQWSLKKRIFRTNMLCCCCCCVAIHSNSPCFLNIQVLPTTRAHTENFWILCECTRCSSCV